MPISLKPGHMQTPQFSINKDWPFEFKLEAKERIDRHRLTCLMGFDIPSDNCTEPTVIRAKWVLFDDGKFSARGETSRELDLGGEQGGGDSETTAFRRLGGSDLKKGHNYVLDFEFTQDGSVLAATDPHLAVEAVAGGFYEDTWIGLFLFYLVPCASVFLLGLGILIYSGVRQHGRSKLA